MKKVYLFIFFLIMIVGCGDKKHSEYDRPSADSKKWSFQDYLQAYPYGFHSCEARYYVNKLDRTKDIKVLDKFVADCLKVKSLNSYSQGKYRNTCREYYQKAWHQIAALVTEKYMENKWDMKIHAMKHYVLNTDIDKIHMIKDRSSMAGKAVLFENGSPKNDRLPEKNRARTYAEAQILIFIVNHNNGVGFGKNNITVSFERIDSTVIFIDLKRNLVIGKEMFLGEDPPSQGTVYSIGGVVTGSVTGEKCPYVYDFIAGMFKEKDSSGNQHKRQAWEEPAWRGWAYNLREAVFSVPKEDGVIVSALHGDRFLAVSQETLEEVIASQRP